MTSTLRQKSLSIVLCFVSANLLSMVHDIAEPHRLCLAHGGYVHVPSAAADTTDLETVDAWQHRESVPSEDVDRHCQLMAMTHQSRLSGCLVTAVVEPLVVRTDHPPLEQLPSDDQIELIHLAPKLSPPLV